MIDKSTKWKGQFQKKKKKNGYFYILPNLIKMKKF